MNNINESLNSLQENLKNILNKRKLRRINESFDTSKKLKNLQKFIDKVKKKFNVCNSNFIQWEPGRCMIAFSDEFDKNDVVLNELMEEFNVFIYNIDNEDTYPEGSTYVYFEAIYSTEVTKDVYKYGYSYHLTKPAFIKNILKEGLIPHISSGGYKKEDYHPERIYGFSGAIDKKLIRTYSVQLLSSALIVINLNKLKKTYKTKLKFFKDPQSLESCAVYTDEYIRPEVLRATTIKDEFI